MNKRIVLIVSALIIITCTVWVVNNTNKKTVFSEKIKVSLREVGHQLLLSNNDTTSLVSPILELEALKYQISFEKELEIQHDSLVSIVKESFKKGLFPTNYIIEVIKCSDVEVAYSYEIQNSKESNIIPCLGRKLEKDCYHIEVVFIIKNSENYLPVLLLLLAILSVLFFFYKSKNKQHRATEKEVSKNNYLAVGSFLFDEEQNRLIKGTTEITLSKKEGELLTIFAANLNKIIKREELTKKVWEDKGVIVGRSLDTYISKLRKILKEDESIQLSNIHGVGYKLHIFKNSK